EKTVGLAGELANRSRDAVADEEERRDLHARALARGKPPEQREERDPFQRHLVELRGMARRGSAIAKHHAPRHVGDAAPERAVDKVAEASGAGADGHEGGEVANQPPPVDALAPGKEAHRHEHAKEAAVKRHAALPYGEDFQRMRKVVLRLVEEHIAE